MIKRISYIDENGKLTSVEVVVENPEEETGSAEDIENKEIFGDCFASGDIMSGGNFISGETADIYAENMVLKEPEVAYGHRKVSGEYTTEDYYLLPDDVRVELIDGVFYFMGAPVAIHQIITLKLAMAFSLYIERKRGKCEVLIGPIDVQLDRDKRTMLQPDIAIVCDRDKLKNQVYGNPDLVVEVISPSTGKKDRTIKLYKYQRAGVREYWIVDPKKKIVEVYVFPDQEMTTLPRVYKFEDRIPVAIFDRDCEVDFGKIYHSIEDLF